MIKVLLGSRGTVNKLAALTLITGLVSLTAAGSAQASSTVNSCDKWSKVSALPWIADDRHPGDLRSTTIALLDAASHGLDPRDYDATALAAQARTLLQRDTRDGTQQVTRFNHQFTRAVSCYLQNVRSGRISPHALYRQIWLPRQDLDVSAQLQAAFDNQSVAQLLADAAPQEPAYQQLRQALASLRAQSQAESSIAKLPKKLTTQLTLGDADPAVAAVRQRLTFLGDLITTSTGRNFDGGRSDTASRYDWHVSEAVKAFQSRHGLTTDGELGNKTLQALNVTMAERIAQVELSMERIRWYPRSAGQRVVKVNIPQFQMQANVTDSDGNTQSLSGKVIVGKPGQSYTPLFAGPISRIEFAPMWYVPQSFAKRKLLPLLRRDPGYLARKDMEFRLPSGKTTQRVTRTLLAQLARGQVSLQQRSGAKNALGQVKFILPNSRAIFMHDTNNRSLFAEDHRALSLGCVRLEKPLELARMLLGSDSRWTEEAVAHAANSKQTTVVNSLAHTTVMLAYETATVDTNGELQFFGDLYGMDKVAMKAVARWSAPQPSSPTDPQLMAELIALKQSS